VAEQRAGKPPLAIRLAASWLTNALLLGLVVLVLKGVHVHRGGSLIAAAPEAWSAAFTSTASGPWFRRR
jgi:hypothetical protein